MFCQDSASRVELEFIRFQNGIFLRKEQKLISKLIYKILKASKGLPGQPLNKSNCEIAWNQNFGCDFEE